MDANTLPSIYGRYILTRKIAMGGMAEVFRAKSFGAENFEKLIAIKRLYPHLSQDPSFVKMFINEAKLAATLNHVNVAPIYDFGCQQGFYYIAMEYVRGADLADLIARCRQRGQHMPLGLAIWLLVEICDGLDYAHRKHDDLGHFLNLIHRDVTPQNVLISYEGEVKITDFGIAKIQMLERDETTGGLLKGKFSYMSPEQVRGDKLDHRSDIFSLGIVAWELLTHHKMFEGPNDYHILEKVREALYIPPRQLNPNLPADVEEIITKMLTRYPEDRYQSVGQVRMDLLRYLSNSRLFPSRAHLSAFVRKLFEDKMHAETEEIVEETGVARQVWSLYQEEIEEAALLDEAITLPPGALDSYDDTQKSFAEYETNPSPPPSIGASKPQSFSHEPVQAPKSVSQSGQLQPFGVVQPRGGESMSQSWGQQIQPSSSVVLDDPLLDDMGFEADEPTLPDVTAIPSRLQPPPLPPTEPPQSSRVAPIQGPTVPPASSSRQQPSVPHPILPPTSQEQKQSRDVLGEQDDFVMRRPMYKRNVSLLVGISTFLIGVILVILLAQWLYPSTKPAPESPNAVRLSPVPRR